MNEDGGEVGSGTNVCWPRDVDLQAERFSGSVTHRANLLSCHRRKNVTSDCLS